MADDMKVITGLWKNTSKAGTQYLAGNIEIGELIATLSEIEKESPKAKVMIFTNGYKENGDNKPDYKMYFAPKEAAPKKAVQEDDVPF
jgi:hypothetical protein